MRNAFIQALFDASVPAHPWLVVGDLGWNAIEPFAESHPERFINAGVSEQSMTSLAAGIASHVGEAVFTYSIANFTTFRCLEQIRNDVVHHWNPVVVVSLGAGFAYGTLGYTHFGIEDIAAIRALPEMPIFSPCDAAETAALTRHLMVSRGPAYLRLGRAEEHSDPPAEAEVVPGRLRCLARGEDAVIIGTGAIALEGVRASRLLREQGISVAVYSAHTVRPFDDAALHDLGRRGVPVITLEEHRLSGGLASTVLESAAALGISIAPLRLGIDRLDHTRAGSRAFLLKRHGLDAVSVASRIHTWLRKPS